MATGMPGLTVMKTGDWRVPEKTLRSGGEIEELLNLPSLIGRLKMEGKIGREERKGREGNGCVTTLMDAYWRHLAGDV